MIAFIETTCDARIPDEDVRPDNFRTVDAIIAMIGSLR
jgi:acyl carrier protein